MRLFNIDPSYRVFALTNSSIILLGIHFSGYNNVHWTLIMMPMMFALEGISGISLARHFWNIFFYRNNPGKKIKLNKNTEKQTKCKKCVKKNIFVNLKAF